MSRTTSRQKGFSTVEGLLVVIIVLLIGFIGYYVWHSNRQTDKVLDTSKTGSSSTAINSFADCKMAAGSIVQESFPEKCVTKDGKSFTQPTKTPTTKYLVIKEWGVKIPLGGPDSSTYYKLSPNIDQSTVNPTNLDVYSTATDSLIGPAGISCKGEYIAFLVRLSPNDPAWQPDGTDSDLSLFGERKVIGDYQYAIATKKEYGPECFERSQTGDYEVDTDTATAFGKVVDTFKADFKNIVAN
jgi:hypothetical protein